MRTILASFMIDDPVSALDGLRKLKKIERMARISHKSEHLITEYSYDKFLRTVIMDRGDWSVAEHALATVRFTVNRGITHEMVRHRLFSFTQESTRFVNYSKPDHEPRYIPSVGWSPEDRSEVDGDIHIIDDIYKKWLSRGYAPQIARDFLPNALAADIAVTGNLRNWRHAFLMRTSKETHPDFRQVMVPLLSQFQATIPILYDDIVPLGRQIDHMRLPDDRIAASRFFCFCRHHHEAEVQS